MSTVDEVAGSDLRRLSGPQPLGANRRRFAGLFWSLTKTDWKVRYENSVLGVFWAFATPVLFALVLYAAFSRFLRFGGEIQDYQAVLIVNITIFGVFSDGTSRGLNALIQRGAVIRQIEVPRLAIPLAALGTVVLTVSLSMVALLPLLLLIGVEPLLTWLLLPVLIGGFAVLVTPMVLILSVLNARFRDVSQAWSPFARAMFYASPVLFPIEVFPPSWEPILQWNPLAPLLAATRQWMVDPEAPSYAEALGGAEHLLIPLGVWLAIVAASIWVVLRQAPRVAEDL